MRELLLVSFGGTQYGIWKDAILSVRDIHALHRIPLSPPRIAGIMMDKGQSVTLGDLSVCIGYQPYEANDQGCILLMADGDGVSGFVANGELRTLSVSPEMLFPLPDYLKTPVFDTCAVNDGISIPIINISELISRLLKAGGETSVFPPLVDACRSRDIAGVERIRFFTVANELYAASAAGIDDMAVKPGPVTPLPHTPRHVKGVTFRDGRLLTVIDLTWRIKRESAAPESLMLTMENAGAEFGFLVDGDGETRHEEQAAIKPVPPIARSSWLKQLVTRNGELVPLVDLVSALSPDSGADDDMPVWQRYTTDSTFPDTFFKRDVEVMEFSLLGERYALPKQEVGDVFNYKKPRALPDVPSIVIGVAEHDGEILPVVDLAMMFGRRSVATPAWRMMLVNNGDFRALAITETVFAERRLPLDMHRTVPIHLPHNLMYGCYPDGNAVRIILNIEAISVHFEKSLIQKFMPALSQEMRMSPTGVVYTFPEETVAQSEHSAAEEKVVETHRPPANEVPARAEPESVPEAVPSAGFAPAETEVEQRAERVAETFAEWEAVDTGIPEKTPEPEVVPEAVPSAGFAPVETEVEQQAERVAETYSEWETADTGTPEITPEPEQIDIAGAAASSVDERDAGTAIEQEHAEQLSEQTVTPETIIAPETIVASETITAAGTTAAAPEPPENIPLPEDLAFREPAADESRFRETAQRKISPLEELKASAKKKRKQQTSARVASGSPPPDPKSAPVDAQPRQPGLAMEPLAAWSSYEERSAAQIWKRGIAIGAIIAALVVVFYFSGTVGPGSSNHPATEKITPDTGPAKMEQAAVQPEQSSGGAAGNAVPVKTEGGAAMEQAEQDQAKAKAELEAKTQAKAESNAKQAAKKTARQTLILSPLVEQNEPPQATLETRAPLELDIPADKPTDIDVYVVREGDTLWSISEQFTGNPYNYPRIAGENRIANPDLIFPGQRIRLIK